MHVIQDYQSDIHKVKSKSSKIYLATAVINLEVPINNILFQLSS